MGRKEKNKNRKRRRRIMEGTVHLAKKYRHAERLIATSAPIPPSADDLEALPVKIGDVEVVVPFKRFNDERRGFHSVQPVVVQIGGRKMEMQCLISCAVMDCE